MKPNSSIIKPCTLCGSECFIDMTATQNGRFCKVICSGIGFCGIAGPTRSNADLAIQLWNARTVNSNMPKVFKNEKKNIDVEIIAEISKGLESLGFKKYE
jgi:hypothetical protein